MRRNYRCIRAVACLAALLGPSVGCEQEAVVNHEAPDAVAPDDQVFQVARADYCPWPRTVRVQGSLAEDQFAIVGAKVAGRVRETRIDLGSQVEAGQIIATLESNDFALRVQQAEAQVSQARAALGLKAGQPDDDVDPAAAPMVLQEKALLEEAGLSLERTKRLIGTRAVTTEELQQRESAQRVAEARYEAALNSVQEQIALLALRRSELALVEQALQDTQLKAPFAGKVQQRHVAPGSFVGVGDPVVTLVRTDPLRFRAGIPERSATGVAVGQAVRVFLEGQETPLEARVSRISPALDPRSRSLIIEADIDNSSGALITGLFAEAEVLVDPNERALAVPESSVFAFGGVEKVWVVRNDTAQSQRIRTGRRQNKMIEVIEGIEKGETILANGHEGREGLVRVQREPDDKPVIASRELIGE